MVESADFDDSGAIAVSIGNANLTGTGLAKESGGNLDTHTKLLNGTQAGALIANTGLTVGQEVAALIATGAATGIAGGTPLLHGVKQVYASGSQVIAISGTFTTPAITITKPGYLIRVTAQMSASSAANPTVKCDVNWTVAASGTPITAQEIWFVPAAAASAMRTDGRGPTKGDTVTITLTNGDSVDTVTVFVTIWETTQHMARDDWRSTGTVGSSLGTPAVNIAYAGILANESVNVGAGATAVRNLPLYCGQASVFINQNAAAGSQVQIFPAGAFSLVSQLAIANLDWTAAPHSLIGVPLPRAWCQIQATNNGAGAVFFNYSVIALEYAS